MDDKRKFLDALASGDNNTANELFKGLIGTVAQDALDNKKIDLAHSVFEAAGNITIEVDLAGDTEEDDKALAKEFKKLKIKSKDVSTKSIPYAHNITGNKESLIKFLTGKLYGMDKEEVQELWPELK